MSTARQVAEEPTTDGPEVHTREPDPAPDPLALDPLSPVARKPGPAELAGPLALDPLSPIVRETR